MSRFLFLCQKFSQIERNVCALLTKGPTAQYPHQPEDPCKLFPTLRPKYKWRTFSNDSFFLHLDQIFMQVYALGVFIYWSGRQHECGGLYVALFEGTWKWYKLSSLSARIYQITKVLDLLRVGNLQPVYDKVLSFKAHRVLYGPYMYKIIWEEYQIASPEYGVEW